MYKLQADYWLETCDIALSSISLARSQLTSYHGGCIPFSLTKETYWTVDKGL